MPTASAAMTAMMSPPLPLADAAPPGAPVFFAVEAADRALRKSAVIVAFAGAIEWSFLNFTIAPRVYGPILPSAPYLAPRS